MANARFHRVRLKRPDLRQPFPPEFVRRLEGRSVAAVSRRAKYLVVPLSSGDTLVMHLGMTGSFRIEAAPPRGRRPSPAADGDHDHVRFDMSSGWSVYFNDPRRFGFMDLVGPGHLDSYPPLERLGPEPLSPTFDGAALALACWRRKTPLKVALMDQTVIAGLGNIYASEALHLAALSPRRLASTIATPAGLPREAAHRLAASIRTVLVDAIDRATGEIYRDSRFRVYDREGAPCEQPGCGGQIRRVTQGGRSTFYCRRCQK